MNTYQKDVVSKADKTAHKNIFVLGFDEEHSEYIHQVADPEQFEFHPLLQSNELIHLKKYDLEDILDRARSVLQEHERIDGIICHWDFPAASIAAILCAEFKLPSPSLEAITKCSHKYWSRLEQEKAAPENTPDFAAIDPFDEEAVDRPGIDFPFWLKPIKAYGSALGFRIDNTGELKQALDIVKQKIRRLGDPINDLLSRIDLPREIEKINGNWLIAEQLVGGREFAPEGYMLDGQFHTHGAFDMIRGENDKSFARYEYPSLVPVDVQERACRIAEKVLRQVGFDNGCFNMEFFWDEDTDQLWIIEINPRISQSHSYQFKMVDGMSNHEIAVHVALGVAPHFEPGAGRYRHAAKCLLRRYDTEDAIVTRVPDKEDLDRLKKRQPDTLVKITVEQDQKLSTMLDEDAYSYVLAEIFVAGKTRDEMLENYREAVEMLPFDFTTATSAG
ncbi:hypothetical protein CWI75_10805 [Kineobactrum sediminis]|uniref:ATP-grasp domain-containing protein n=1 Tax=Kineobactrum sediminis TaxID=1905677 RepID=A0A2N5Y1L6_9GAMM|nr:ATP-grasp domain-containing protein [Kineobactrum sediminis]PLW82259.1 hypothetical protein CWI75_10805 [Kineobactrum sediminis]